MEVIRETLKEAIAGIAATNGNYKIRVYYENNLAHDFIESDTIKAIIEKYGNRHVDSYEYSNGEYIFIV